MPALIISMAAAAILFALAPDIQKMQRRVSHPIPMNSPRWAGRAIFSLKVQPSSSISCSTLACRAHARL
eukprot:1343419-Rhodomonas_salina.1